MSSSEESVNTSSKTNQSGQQSVAGAKKLKKIGALWKKTYVNKSDNKKGKMISGALDLGILGSISIVIFKNNKKTTDKSPDYYMYVARSPQPSQTTEPPTEIEEEEDEEE